MKHLILVLKFLTASVWLPLWLVKRGIRLIVILVAGAILSSCATSSSKLEKSPCACSFESINATHLGRRGDV
jgi:hypothetical protein